MALRRTHLKELGLTTSDLSPDREHVRDRRRARIPSPLEAPCRLNGRWWHGKPFENKTAVDDPEMVDHGGLCERGAEQEQLVGPCAVSTKNGITASGPKAKPVDTDLVPPLDRNEPAVGELPDSSRDDGLTQSMERRLVNLVLGCLL